MTKYLIEGNINFYEELCKSSDKEDSLSDDNNCLISQKPLSENCVTMLCGHKFNYQPLFYDMLNHKKKYNSMERNSLRTTDIRCPYCRNVQKKLLPYVEGYPKVHGVNHYDENSSSKSSRKYVNNSMKLVNDGYIVGDCCYESSKIGENGEPVKCKNDMVKILTNNKFYCPLHKYVTIKKIMQESNLKLKNENKLKLKEEKKKAKEDEKMKKLEEKMKLKAEKNKNPILDSLVSSDENVVVGGEVIGCSQLLKTGIKKGAHCNCKVFKDGVCKRHYGLLNKKTTEIIDLTKEE